MIEFVNIYKNFGNKTVYKGLDLTIQDGESLVIIGQSGVGKSVLLKHIVRLLYPDSGSVYIDGINIVKTSSKKVFEIRKKFGFVFQGGALFDSMTVSENVGLPLKEHTSMNENQMADRVAEKLELVGMQGTQKLMPIELSGGMRKRVAIARAIVMEPAYILYDEPTTGLDPILAARINELIVDLNTKLNITGIVVTHDIESAYTIASRIALLHDGSIIFSGTPEQAKKSDNPYLRQFLRGQSEGPIKISDQS